MTTIAALSHMERRLEVVKRYEKPVVNRIVVCPKCQGDMFWEEDMELVGGIAAPGHGWELVCNCCGNRL